MFDHIALWPFAEEPARKDAIPFLIAGILHQQLHKGSGFGGVFPWGGLFARAQPHDHIAHAAGFARLHGEILNQAIALVQQADFSNPIGHRGNACHFVHDGSRRFVRFQLHRNALRAFRCCGFLITA